MNPPAWEHEQGADVRRLGDAGQMTLAGRRWEISKTLAGEWVQLIRIRERILVGYCRSLVRELDPGRWQPGRALPRKSVRMQRAPA